MIMSALFVTLVLVSIIQGQIKFNCENFLLTKKELESQKRMIELEQEFTNEIFKFLPGEIGRRIKSLVKDRKLNIIDAIEKLMEIRKTNVVPLFCDIRQFTSLSKLHENIQDKVIAPNLSEAVDIVERNSGIPRQVADLIVSFFDDQCIKKNVARAMLSALEMLYFTQELNKSLKPSERVFRYAILTSGQAHVGNFGGYRASREFTAMGTCMNLAHRIDDLTKKSNFRSEALGCMVVFSSGFKTYLDQIYPGLITKKIFLKELALEVKDFPEIETVWVVEPTFSLIAHFKELLKNIEQSTLEGEGLSNENSKSFLAS